MKKALRCIEHQEIKSHENDQVKASVCVRVEGRDKEGEFPFLNPPLLNRGKTAHVAKPKHIKN